MVTRSGLDAPLLDAENFPRCAEPGLDSSAMKRPPWRLTIYRPRGKYSGSGVMTPPTPLMGSALERRDLPEVELLIALGEVCAQCRGAYIGRGHPHGHGPDGPGRLAPFSASRTASSSRRRTTLPAALGDDPRPNTPCTARRTLSETIKSSTSGKDRGVLRRAHHGVGASSRRSPSTSRGL